MSARWPCRDCGAATAADACHGCIQRAQQLGAAPALALRPPLVERLDAAGLEPERVEGTAASWRARCPSCRTAGARRITHSVRVTATPSGPLVSCARGCPSPTIMRALDALDGWGTAP